MQVKAGETLKKVDKIETSRKMRFEQSSEERLAASLGAGKLFEVLSAKIETHLAQKYTSEDTVADQAGHSVERTFSLPKEPEKPDALHVVSRAFQRAPVYRRIQLFLRIICSSCRRNELTSIIVSQPTGEIATRNHDTLLRGEARIVPTGIHKFAVP